MTDFDKRSAQIFHRVATTLQKSKLDEAVSVEAIIQAAESLAKVQAESNGFRDVAALRVTRLTAFDQARARQTDRSALARIIAGGAMSLASGFRRMKAALYAQSQAIRVENLQAIIDVEDVGPDGRYTSAHELPAQTAPPAKQPRPNLSFIAEPPGAIEMLRRVALAHRVNVDDILLEGDHVLWRDPIDRSKLRPICKVGSAFWLEIEQQVSVLNRIAEFQDLDARALYVRDGAVYEESPESFVDREICKVNSRDWDDAHRRLLQEQAGVPRQRFNAGVFAESVGEEAREKSTLARPRL